MGHYLLAVANIEKSEIVIMDSLNNNFHNSPYFDSALVLHIIKGIMTEISKTRGQQVRPMHISQRGVQQQSGVDCGPNVLLNCEMILNKMDPGEHRLNSDEFRKVRSYHFLKRFNYINDCRLRPIE